jgi:hypothetical protein
VAFALHERMKRATLLLLFLSACTTAPPPALTPPPPIRPENAATATGVIRDASGRPVPRARIRAWAADLACRTVGSPETSVSGEDGSYQVRVARGVGPQFDGCIVVEAASGGANATSQQQVHYAPDTAGGNSVHLDLTMPPAKLLTRAEADRLIALVDAAMRYEGNARDELSLYVVDLAKLDALAQYTRGIESTRVVSDGDRRFVYEIRGRRPERNVEITISQDALTRIELP